MNKNIRGTLNRPRLYVFKSNKHIYVQLIDDYNKKIITSSSTISNETRDIMSDYANCKSATIVGTNIAMKLKEYGIKQVVFDRGNKIYHGKIKALAEAARKAGIDF